MACLYECDNCKKQEAPNWVASVLHGWVDAAISHPIDPTNPQQYGSMFTSTRFVACSEACMIRLLQQRIKPLDVEDD